jgi:hypothetical protein
LPTSCRLNQGALSWDQKPIQPYVNNPGIIANSGFDFFKNDHKINKKPLPDFTIQNK